jgi:DNA-binding transcriptional LysR family regulator
MSLTERLSDMAIFARVVDRAGFSAAARELGMSTGAVSKAVARLEAHLGARLLQRSTRRLSPTEAGLAFHAYCRAVVEQADEAEQHLGQLQAAPRCVLRIAAPLAFGLVQVAPRLASFRAQYPEVEIELELRESAVDMIGGAFDLRLQLGEPADASLVARRLATSRRLVVASPDYLDARGVPRQPEDLQQHACLRTLAVSDERWAFSGREGEREVRVGGPLRANSELALRDSVLAGLGVARLPSFLIAEDLAGGRLKCLFAHWTPKAEGLYACYPHRRHLPAKVRAALDFFAAAFGPVPYWDEVLNDSQCRC